MRTVDFNAGVTSPILETMLGEVFDSMVFAGVLSQSETDELQVDDALLTELSASIAQILNTRIGRIG